MELFEKARKYSRESEIASFLASAPFVIVGFSGGADSRVLLSFLLSERKNFPSLKIIAAHMNHMIRGEEAFSDEEFCKKVCLENAVPIEVKRADIPALAKESGMGLEEAARDARYSFFEELCQKYEGALIATAHNADDNLETVIFNLARGSGTKGISGISPVRDGKYIRPMLSCTSKEIRKFAEESGIQYVTDSTNRDTAYTRNSIRHGISPILRKINPKAAEAALRLSRAARLDCDFIEAEAQRFLFSDTPTRESLAALHPALFQRVLHKLYKEAAGCDCDLSEKNINDCRRLLENPEGGMISLPHELAFFADKYGVGVSKDPRFDDDKAAPPQDPVPIQPERYLKFADYLIFCTENNNYVNTIEENIYKLSLHIRLDCDRINGNLFVRGRRSGDTVRLRKMNRKLKKLFCDGGVPKEARDSLPIIEDSEGIIYVPFIGARDGCEADANTEKILNLHIFKRSRS